MGRYFKAKIKTNLSLNTKNGLLTISPLDPIKGPKPGQFFMIEVGSSHDPLLKRPFSFFRKTFEGIQFLYTVRGKGTSLMRDLKQGKIIHVLGPLGSGYPEPKKGELPLLVAGGIGIASIFSLLESFAVKAQVFYGAREKNELLILDELKRLTDKVIISTDDGSFGEKGTVVDVLNNFLTTHYALLTSYLLYVCGSRPMLEAVSRLVLEKGMKGYVSVEENMACGVGACLGCAVKVKSKRAKSKGQKSKSFNSTLSSQPLAFCYRMVCKDGPVFPIEDIVW